MKPVAILVKPTRLVHKPKVPRKVHFGSSQGLRLPLTPNRSTFALDRSASTTHVGSAITRKMRAAQKLRAAGAENAQALTTKSRTKPILIDLTALEDSDSDASLVVDAPVSKADTLTPNIAVEHFSPEPMDISDDETQDLPSR